MVVVLLHYLEVRWIVHLILAYRNYTTNVQNNIEYNLNQSWNFGRTINDSKSGIPREMKLYQGANLLH